MLRHSHWTAGVNVMWWEHEHQKPKTLTTFRALVVKTYTPYTQTADPVLQFGYYWNVCSVAHHSFSNEWLYLRNKGLNCPIKDTILPNCHCTNQSYVDLGRRMTPTRLSLCVYIYTLTLTQTPVALVCPPSSHLSLPPVSQTWCQSGRCSDE